MNSFKTLLFASLLLSWNGCIDDVSSDPQTTDSGPDTHDGGMKTDLDMKKARTDVKDTVDVKEEDIIVPETCGNGVINVDEDCEAKELRGANCQSEGFEHGKLTCSATCTLDTSACYSCGDGNVDKEEVCDGTNFDGKTCSTELKGAANGKLKCADDCKSFEQKECVLKYSQVEAGSKHVCGLRVKTGKVDCWGGNTGTIPKDSFTMISAGAGYTCGILAKTKGIKCWGKIAGKPIKIFRETYIHLNAGREHACAIKTDRTIECWGEVASINADRPKGKFQYVHVGADKMACASMNGNLTCWGKRKPTLIPRTAYTKISLFMDICGIKKDKTISCKNGSNPKIYKKFNGDITAPLGTYLDMSENAEDIFTINGIRLISNYACYLNTNNRVSCLSNAEKVLQPNPTEKFKQITTGLRFACGLKTDDSIYCWKKDGGKPVESFF